LISLLDQKCAARGIAYKNAYDFISEDLLAVAKIEWQQQLQPFVTDVPPAGEMLPGIKTLILSIWE
jgi:hypothetical protein